MKYLHTMIRVSDPDATVRFFELLGLKEVRRMESEKGRFTLIFLAAPGDIPEDGERASAEVELTYNRPRNIPAAAISAISPIGSRISMRPASD
jgi:lactoylglutathione lyase